MGTMKTQSVLFQIALAAVLCVSASAAPAVSPREAWKQIIQNRLALYGHRNWIVVADSAYPSQSAEGIETIVSDAGQIEVLDYVLKALAGSRHVIPTIYTDQELRFLTDKDAPGISGYRDQLFAMLQDRRANALLHEQLIGKLDSVSKGFRVLIIKTNIALPYTSVFLQLDCSYWPLEAEGRLRARMMQHTK
jgi:hypothetical protein